MFAVGGVYAWGAVPIVAAALLLAIVARPRLAASSETRLLDRLLLVGAAALLLQLLPLPPLLRGTASPRADAVRAALDLGGVFPAAGGPTAGWHPLTLAPGATASALALVAASMIVFWVCRQLCGRGLAHRIVRHVAFIALPVALIALAQSIDDSRLIYGLWRPLDAEARPFGPFVNRNHFATWALMAFPLAAAYVATTIQEHPLPPSLTGRVAAAVRGLGTGAAWAAAAALLLVLGLVASASRSGLIALAASLAGGVWIARHRLDRRGRALGLAVALLLAAAIAAYADWAPLLSRVEETLDVGTGGRPAIWRESRRVFADFWATGTGLGAFPTAMLVYQQMDRTFFVNQAHQMYLQLAAEGGLLLLVPALLSAVAFVSLFRLRLARDHSPQAWLRLGGATAVLAVAVQSWWETGLRIPANGLLFAVAAALAVHRPARSGD